MLKYLSISLVVAALYLGFVVSGGVPFLAALPIAIKGAAILSWVFSAITLLFLIALLVGAYKNEKEFTKVGGMLFIFLVTTPFHLGLLTWAVFLPPYQNLIIVLAAWLVHCFRTAWIGKLHESHKS